MWKKSKNWNNWPMPKSRSQKPKHLKIQKLKKIWIQSELFRSNNNQQNDCNAILTSNTNSKYQFNQNLKISIKSNKHWYLWHINIKSLPYAFLIIKKLFFIFRLFLRFYRRKVFKVLPWFILADFLFIAAILETVHILERTFWLQKFQFNIKIKIPFKMMINIWSFKIRNRCLNWISKGLPVTIIKWFWRKNRRKFKIWWVIMMRKVL